MTDAAIIRLAVEGDYALARDLYETFHRDDSVWDADRMEDRWRALMRFNGASVIVCERQRELVSTCTLVIVPNMTRAGRPYALIENVVTRADCRRLGYARKTLAYALRRAWDQDCYKVMLLSGEQNTQAHRLYESLGFDRSKIGFQIRNP